MSEIYKSVKFSDSPRAQECGQSYIASELEEIRRIDSQVLRYPKITRVSKVYAVYPWQNLMPLDVVQFFNKQGEKDYGDYKPWEENVFRLINPKKASATLIPNSISPNGMAKTALESAYKIAPNDNFSSGLINEVKTSYEQVHSHLYSVCKELGFFGQDGDTLPSNLIKMPILVYKRQIDYKNAIKEIDDLTTSLYANGLTALVSLSVRHQALGMEYYRLGHINSVLTDRYSRRKGIYKSAKQVRNGARSTVHPGNPDYKFSFKPILDEDYNFPKIEEALGIARKNVLRARVNTILGAYIPSYQNGKASLKDSFANMPSEKDVNILQNIDSSIILNLDKETPHNYYIKENSINENIIEAFEAENIEDYLFDQNTVEIIRQISEYYKNDASSKRILGLINKLQQGFGWLNEKQKTSLHERFFNLFKNKDDYQNMPATDVLILLTYAKGIGVEGKFLKILDQNDIYLSAVNKVSIKALQAYFRYLTKEESIHSLVKNANAKILAQILDIDIYARSHNTEGSNNGKKNGEKVSVKTDIFSFVKTLSKSTSVTKRGIFSKLLVEYSKKGFECFIPNLGEFYKEIIKGNSFPKIYAAAKSIRHGISQNSQVALSLENHVFERLDSVTNTVKYINLSRAFSSLSEDFTLQEISLFESLARDSSISRKQLLPTYKFLKRANVQLSKDLLSYMCSTENSYFRRLVRETILNETKYNQILLDYAYFKINGEEIKAKMLENILQIKDQDKDVLLERVAMLRRAGINQLTDNSTISDLLKYDQQWHESFYRDIPEKTFKEYSHMYNNAIEAALLEIGINSKHLQGILIPDGFIAFRKEMQIRKMPYSALITDFVCTEITKRKSLVEIKKIANNLISRNIYRNYSDANEIAKNESVIAAEFWKYIAEKSKTGSKKYILILNESTGPRYFGRDAVNPKIAQKLKIAQHIDDDGLLDFLEEKRENLRNAAKKIRNGFNLNKKDQILVSQIMNIMNATDETRIIPMQEVKIKSGSNDHDILMTSQVLEDVHDLAEVLKADIIFSDISSRVVGRSQTNAREFYLSRGLRVGAEGKLANQIIYSENIWDKLFKIISKRVRRGTKVTLINYDPNSTNITATGDDSPGFTVRNKIGPNGRYEKTSLQVVFPQITGGFVKAEDYWKTILISNIENVLSGL